LEAQIRRTKAADNALLRRSTGRGAHVPESLIGPVITRLAKLAASSHWRVKARDKNSAARVLAVYVRLEQESIRLERETVDWHALHSRLQALEDRIDVAKPADVD
jgi:hypothetical protein